ncbi:MAG: hypothetical protein EOP86_15450 [Verrucomicrobiaceae bacterium]|nr:MAG: hypothetical protein EOP86_15450 [Verrucomicrobiaceae bacterium]
MQEFPSTSGPQPDFRAGRYVSQPTGYRAFLPAPLPPVPPIRMEGGLQSLLSIPSRQSLVTRHRLPATTSA